jgi:hypothetical protein
MDAMSGSENIPDSIINRKIIQDQTALAIARIQTSHLADDYSLAEKLAFQTGLDITIGLVYSGTNKLDILHMLVAYGIAIKESIDTEHRSDSLDPFNPLGISIPDVDIDMGYFSNQTTRVRLNFRRSIDKTIVDYFNNISSVYGWRVTFSTEQFRKIGNWVVIDCIGSKSDTVGNSIGSYLINEHKLTVRYCQFVSNNSGGTVWDENVESLKL